MIQLIEYASDEIGRLDQRARGADFAADLFLRLEALADLLDELNSGEAGGAADIVPREGTDRRRMMLAAEVDPFHESALEEGPRRWMGFVREEVRRARGGALPALDRWCDVVPTLATYSHREALEGAWRDGDRATQVLAGAVAAAAWAPDDLAGEALAALLLVARGRTADFRLLPFRSVLGAERVGAVDAWRRGEPEPWTEKALEAVAREARRQRLRLDGIAASGAAEWDRLAQMGRRGHTARRALPMLRTQGALTRPILAEDLGISRPAATETLVVLAEAGCAVELTGRARDRVWGYAPLVAGAR
jgi:hypothetical protein